MRDGANDVSKTIAKLVGSGVTTYRAGIAWGMLWTMIDASIAAKVATAMGKTFSSALLQPRLAIPSALAPAILAGSIL